MHALVLVGAAAMLAACTTEQDSAAEQANQVAPAAGPVAAVPPEVTPKEAAKPAPVVAHLASYSRLADAMRGWAKLRLQYKEPFANLEGRTIETQIQGRNYTRLLAAGFASDEEARRFCDWAKSVKLYCVLMPLQGTPLRSI